MTSTLTARSVYARARARVGVGQNVNVRRERSRRWVRAVTEDIAGRIVLFFLICGRRWCCWNRVKRPVLPSWMPVPLSWRWVPCCSPPHRRPSSLPGCEADLTATFRRQRAPFPGKFWRTGNFWPGVWRLCSRGCHALSDDPVPCCHRPDMRRWVLPAESRLTFPRIDPGRNVDLGCIVTRNRYPGRPSLW